MRNDKFAEGFLYTTPYLVIVPKGGEETTMVNQVFFPWFSAIFA